MGVATVKYVQAIPLASGKADLYLRVAHLTFAGDNNKSFSAFARKIMREGFEYPSKGEFIAPGAIMAIEDHKR